MDIITKDTVIKWAEKNKDSTRTNGACLYTLDGKTPNCIVANFLAENSTNIWNWILENKDKACKPNPDIHYNIHIAAKVNESGIENIRDSFNGPIFSAISPQAIDLLKDFQLKADNSSWNDAGTVEMFPNWGETIRSVLAESGQSATE